MQSAARKNKALAYYALADKVSIPADMDWWTACKLVSEKGPKVDKNAKAIISDIGGNYRTVDHFILYVSSLTNLGHAKLSARSGHKLSGQYGLQLTDAGRA